MDQGQLVRLLMEREYVSGEWISGQLGVTRAAVWKAIEGLRAQGYDVQSVKKKGYRLVPPGDAVWPSAIREHLSARWAGRLIEYHPVIDSTNLRARALGMEGAPHGTLVVADHQTAGRGRLSRAWEEKSGEGILMSLLLRPQELPPAQASGIVLIAALAAAQACRMEGAQVGVKWPNDLIVGGKKLSGTLLDMSADMDQVHFAVVGIGINVRSFPHSPELPHAACLADACGRDVPRARVIAHFLEGFEALYDLWRKEGTGAILPMYREYSITLGRRVKVVGLKETFEALALDVLEDGALEVQKDNGEREIVRAGDVSVRGVMDYA